jgi:hypothetical protein
MIDYTITIGNIIEIASIVGGGLAVLWTLKADVTALKLDLTAMQTEIKKLGEILVNLADIRGEIRVLETRVTASEQDIRELRHGHGQVRGPAGLEREYPR